MLIETKEYVKRSTFAKERGISTPRVNALLKKKRLENVVIDGIILLKKDQIYKKSEVGRPKKVHN